MLYCCAYRCRVTLQPSWTVALRQGSHQPSKTLHCILGTLLASSLFCQAALASLSHSHAHHHIIAYAASEHCSPQHTEVVDLKQRLAKWHSFDWNVKLCSPYLQDLVWYNKCKYNWSSMDRDCAHASAGTLAACYQDWYLMGQLAFWAWQVPCTLMSNYLLHTAAVTCSNLDCYLR